MRQPLSQPRPCGLPTGARTGVVRGPGAVYGGEAAGGGAAVTLGGSGVPGGGKNSGEGPAAASLRAGGGVVVVVRDDAVFGRAAPEPADVPLAGRDDDGVLAESAGRVPRAGAGRFGPVVSRTSDEPGDDSLVRLVGRDEGPAEAGDAPPLVGRAEVFQEASQTTQVRLSWALWVPHLTQSHPRAGASGCRGLLRRAGLASSHTKHVPLLRVLCVPQAAHCHVGFAGMVSQSCLSAFAVSLSRRPSQVCRLPDDFRRRDV
jgi:hypothetical protein